MPLLAAVGRDETDGFKRWSRDFAELWAARGGAVQHMEPPRRNHFTLLDPLADGDDPLTRAILALARFPEA
jgi:arylformamidase